MVHQEQFSFETTGHRHMADITDQVTAIVGRSGVKTGVVQVFCVGSTAAVGTIEFEPGLQRDLPEMLDRLGLGLISLSCQTSPRNSTASIHLLAVPWLQSIRAG